MILKINQLSREKIETYLSIVDKNNKIFDVIYVNKIHSFCGKIIFYLNEVYSFYKEKIAEINKIKLLEEEKARYQEKMIVNIIKK